LSEFKKRKTPINKQTNPAKHTFIQNPKTKSQFKIINDKNNEGVGNINNNPNNFIAEGGYCQNIPGVAQNGAWLGPPKPLDIPSDNDDDDNIDTFTDEICSENEKINKLHIKYVKQNNLTELNNKNYFNVARNNMNNNNNGSDHYNGGGGEEFFFGESGGPKNFVPVAKSFNEKNNTSTRFSTNESNDSFDSGNYNKYNFYDDNRYVTPNRGCNFNNTNIPNQNQNPNSNMSSFAQRKINFTTFNNNLPNNCNNNLNGGNPCMNFQKSSSVCIPGHYGPSPINANNNNFIQYSQTPNGIYSPNIFGNFYSTNIMNNINNSLINVPNPQQNINAMPMPENAFTINVDTGNKNNSDKKKTKKSKEELDQTLFLINLDNIIQGKDQRTTIMIRHIPNKYSTQSLLDEINAQFKGKYDFFYLPMDFEVNIFSINFF
jgi:hypothetical protein